MTVATEPAVNAGTAAVETMRTWEECRRRAATRGAWRFALILERAERGRKLALLGLNAEVSVRSGRLVPLGEELVVAHLLHRVRAFLFHGDCSGAVLLHGGVQGAALAGHSVELRAGGFQFSRLSFLYDAGLGTASRVALHELTYGVFGHL